MLRQAEQPPRRDRVECQALHLRVRCSARRLWSSTRVPLLLLLDPPALLVPAHHRRGPFRHSTPAGTPAPSPSHCTPRAAAVRPARYAPVVVAARCGLGLRPASQTRTRCCMHASLVRLQPLVVTTVQNLEWTLFGRMAGCRVRSGIFDAIQAQYQHLVVPQSSNAERGRSPYKVFRRNKENSHDQNTDRTRSDPFNLCRSRLDRGGLTGNAVQPSCGFSSCQHQQPRDACERPALE